MEQCLFGRELVTTRNFNHRRRGRRQEKHEFCHDEKSPDRREVAKLKRPTFGFGMHLLVDGYGCDRRLLEDLSLIYTFLSDYPSRINMTKIMPPYVFRYDAKNQEDWGISGFVLIAESHISIHTFPEKNYLSVDIFSCKEFDAEQAISHVSRLFAAKKTEVKLLDRGMEFPRDIRGAARIVREERHRLEH
jgi:S-adenosylmethionine decarboxylase